MGFYIYLLGKFVEPGNRARVQEAVFANRIRVCAIPVYEWEY